MISGHISPRAGGQILLSHQVAGLRNPGVALARYMPDVQMEAVSEDGQGCLTGGSR